MEQNLLSTECVMDLDLRLVMIIFESILTTFEASVIFLGSWGGSKNWHHNTYQKRYKFAMKAIGQKNLLKLLA